MYAAERRVAPRGGDGNPRYKERIFSVVGSEMCTLRNEKVSTLRSDTVTHIELLLLAPRGGDGYPRG